MKIRFLFLFVAIPFVVWSQDLSERRKLYLNKLQEIDFSEHFEASINQQDVWVYPVTYPLGISELNQENRDGLNQMFDKIEKNNLVVTKIEIFGHTDLFETRDSANFDYKSVCREAKIDSSTNQALGYVRGYKVYEFLQARFARERSKKSARSLRKPIYHDDCFLACCNNKLAGKLVKDWGLRPIPKELKTQMDSLKRATPAKEYGVTTLRNAPALQHIISKRVGYYAQQFSPYRCVMVVVRVTAPKSSPAQKSGRS